jgi:predicted AlkP superfamily pyrophosphatase or phosphodiesterase
VSRVIVVSIDGFAGFYWNDRRLKIPTLRALARDGVVSTAVETAFPSTTWPGHASLVTGVRPSRHGVVGNSILNRLTGVEENLTGDPVYDFAQLYRAPTIADLARAAGKRCAAIDWPGTRRSPSFDFNLPFFKDQTIFEVHTARETWTEVAGLGYPVERMGEWADLPKRFLKDGMVGDLARDVVARHAPDLMLVHFLCTDSFQHLHGPRSPEAYWAIEYVDERIARLLGSLAPGEVPGRTTVVVVSDHGFMPVEREIRVNARLRKAGLLSVDTQGRIREAQARSVANGGSAYVYVLGGNRVPIAQSVARELRRLEGVAHVWTEEAYAGLGLPTPRANSWVGDVLIEAAPGYMLVDDPTGHDDIGLARRYRGAHGHLGTRPENLAFFMASGPRIRAGIDIGPIASIDVAPTIAAMLDLEMPDTDGRALSQIFLDL